jgi:hypothetical protein
MSWVEGYLECKHGTTKAKKILDDIDWWWVSYIHVPKEVDSSLW